MSAAGVEMLIWAAWGAGLLLAVALSAIYNGMETGIYVLNKMRLDLRAEGGSRPARLIRRQLHDANHLMAVLLSGTNAANYLATFLIAAMFVRAGAGDNAEWYTIALTAPVLFILAESVPKAVFHQSAETLVYRLAWVLKASSVFFTLCGLAPLIRGFAALLMKLTPARRHRRPLLGHEGVASIVAEGAATGALTHIQSVMADRVMNIAAIRLSDVMIPMEGVVSAPHDVARRDLMQLIRNQHHWRLPLLGGQGQVVGVLDIYDVLTSDEDVRPADLAAAPLVLGVSLNVTDALYGMQQAHAAIAVVESAGKHVGVVTVKDLIEEIVGEIEAW